MKAFYSTEEEYNDDPINEDDFRDENGNLDNEPTSPCDDRGDVWENFWNWNW